MYILVQASKCCLGDGIMQDQGIDKEELSRIAETVRGDAASYGYIVDKYKDCIYGLCLKMTGSRHEADDLTQEIFLKSFKNLKQYSVQYKFINWLYTLALNIIRNHLRRKRILSFFPLGNRFQNDDGEEIVFEPEDKNGAAPGKPQAELAAQWTEKIIMSLSPVLRATFVLRYVDNLKYDEIASILGVSINTVKVHLNRARTFLFDKYSKQYDETFLP
ncbi:MAG: hypothetical protein A2314_07295 [Elusimicrobia bacterium RIFOXYB2_FULL_50_12]|nr:MAG: hypothetical protein A2314_07295 [Elusimicrobia bacterium RIFOXYB2_FULL_50_12]